MVIWNRESCAAERIRWARCRWWPGTPSWYQMLTSSQVGNSSLPRVGSQVRPGREKSRLGRGGGGGGPPAEPVPEGGGGGGGLGRRGVELGAQRVRPLGGEAGEPARAALGAEPVAELPDHRADLARPRVQPPVQTLLQGGP